MSRSVINVNGKWRIYDLKTSTLHDEQFPNKIEAIKAATRQRK